MRECEEGGGFTSEVGFYGMAIATSFCALMGVYKVQQKQVDEHRRWMVRNIMFIYRHTLKDTDGVLCPPTRDRTRQQCPLLEVARTAMEGMLTCAIYTAPYLLTCH